MSDRKTWRDEPVTGKIDPKTLKSSTQFADLVNGKRKALGGFVLVNGELVRKELKKPKK